MTGTEERGTDRVPKDEPQFTSVEICAGAGGQAIGLHQAGFRHLALVEIDPHAGRTLTENVASQPGWKWEKQYCDLLLKDVKDFEPDDDLLKSAVWRDRELDLLAGGVPCPPFSHAGRQLGKADERDLFPEMLELVVKLQPRAVMIENVRGIMDPKFSEYREWITGQLEGGFPDQSGAPRGPRYELGEWGVLEASKFGVPQLRPRAILVAFREDVIKDLKYEWPSPTHDEVVPVVEALDATMRERYEAYSRGPYAERARAAHQRWIDKAGSRHRELLGKGGGIAPTLVGGSKKHGGADLGPSRAKEAWKKLGVSGLGVANDPDICRNKGTEGRDLFGSDGPMLTVQQAAIIQGFPPEWRFTGGKTACYRQVGNAFPPPVAAAVGTSIIQVLEAARERDESRKRASRRS